MSQLDVGTLPPELLTQLLKQRGLSASGGNIRLTPFDNGAEAAGSGIGATPRAGDATASSQMPTPESLGLTPNGDGTFTDPSTGQQLSADDLGSILPYILAGAGIASGVVGADALRRRVPKVSGEVIPPDPLAPLDPVNGEYTEVDAARQLGRNRAANANTPPGSPRAIGSTPRQIAGPANQLERSVSNGMPAIAAADAMGDISPEDMQRANDIADELVNRRLMGNTNPLTAAKRGLPTGPVNRNSLLNTVIGIMRNAGKAGAGKLVRAIP